MVAACLEDIEKAHEIALEVGARVLDGVADARLRREVHNDVEAVLREQAFDNVIGLIKQLLDEERTDEAGSARHEHFTHYSPIIEFKTQDISSCRTEFDK